MHSTKWVYIALISLANLAVTGCGSFGGVRCDPTIDYPKDHPCYQDKQKP